MTIKHIAAGLLIGLLTTGCTYKVSTTSNQVKIDGSKVDFSNMEQYTRVEQCYQVGTEGTTSVVRAVQKAGIKYIVHVDYSIKGTEKCAIVYGK